MKLPYRVLSGIGLTVVLLSQVSTKNLADAQKTQFKSFTDWCLNKEKISPAARHTVDVLLQHVGTNECHQANQKLLQLTGLQVNLKRISDVSPIASLTNLKALGLGANQIIDISPLQSLTNLTVLNLPSNQISDIRPLQTLTNLTSLDLASNRITDISALKSLTKLTSLDLSVNQIHDTSPLKSLTNLTEVNLQSNPVSSRACRQIVRQGYGAGSSSGRIICRV